MQAYKYIVDVNQHGKIRIPKIPQIKISKVEIILLPLQQDDYSDLMNASFLGSFAGAVKNTVGDITKPLEDEWELGL